MSLTELRLRAARARIAAACAPAAVDPRLGVVTLRPDQCASAARVSEAIARHGGCVLADEVGRGKTYVALAVARNWIRPLVVIPAALHSTWRDAMERACVPCDLVSHEALSRGCLPSDTHDGIVVDESHHFRSTNTRRYGALTQLAARARLLLLSATPLQNRARDLAAQVALFHGARAFSLDESALASFVVRGGAVDAGLLPTVAPPRWARPAIDDGAVLEAILSLPAPARPGDGGDAGVLRTIGLVRAWASSRAALRATIRRRRRAATAIEASIAEGRVPTRSELAAWHEVDGAIQLGFAPLLVTTSAIPAQVADLAEAVSVEQDALRRLDVAISVTSDPDEARVSLLRELRDAHAGARVLAFTEFATTAEAYFRGIRSSAGVGLLTAREARIASGRLPRDALLARFAPQARGVRPPVHREAVTVLVATDLLSEGVNLQDASVVVHLDLPWNPARLAQRVGRVRRPGGAAVVHSYLVGPPAGAALLLDLERRLREKLRLATGTIGRGIEVVPTLASPTSVIDARSDGHATIRGEALHRITRWARPMHQRCRGRIERPLIAAVRCSEVGWLAALDDGRLLVCRDGGAPTADDGAVARAVPLCERPARSVTREESAMAIAACVRWLEAELLSRQCGQVRPSRSVDRVVDRQVALAVERMPRHLRPVAVARASQLIATAGVPRPLGAERALRQWLGMAGDRGSVGWLDRAVELATEIAHGPPGPDGMPRLVALVLFGPVGAP